MAGRARTARGELWMGVGVVGGADGGGVWLAEAEECEGPRVTGALGGALPAGGEAGGEAG